MPNTIKYDVIIAGGGPAGSTAGYILAKAGLNVLIIDKGRFPKKKLCAGLIPHKTVTLLERVFGITPESLKQKDIINYESFSYEIRSTRSLISKRTSQHPLMFVDRDKYDHHLLKKAELAGVEIIEGEGIQSIDVLKSSVTTTAGRKVSGEIIIGADGANSRIRSSFPVDLFGREKWSNDLAAAFEIIPDRNKIKKQFDHPMLYYGFVDWGYAWIFPNKDRLKIGMCALKRKNTKKVLTAFRDFLSAMDLGDIQDEKIEAYVLPYGNFLPSPVFKNILLVGDAAGFADPLIGEGIFYAQRSAELAAQAILECRGMARHAPADISARYIQSLKEHIFTELIYAGKIQNSIFTRQYKFDFLLLKLFMRIFGHRTIETIHGLRSYQWMRKL